MKMPRVMRSARNTTLAALGIAALGLATLAACSDPSTAPPKAPKPLDALPRPLTAAEQKVASAGNDFSFALFRRVSEAQPDENVFVSPLSASMALGMTMNGAAGSTYDAMRAALGFGGASQEEINDGYKGLIALLRGLDPTTDFRIANSIWYRRDFPFEQAFLNTTKSAFDAEVAGLDFANPASLTTINGWVNRSTNGKITTIIDEIRDDDVMFLINAIYFKGLWQSRFDRGETRDAPFHALGGAAQEGLLEVAVDALGRVDRGVAELALDVDQRQTRGQPRRRRSVAQVVQAQRRAQRRILEGRLVHVARDVRARQRPPVRAAEHQGARSGAPAQALVVRLQAAEDSFDAGPEVDRPETVALGGTRA
jgi:hypothetical protein